MDTILFRLLVVIAVLFHFQCASVDPGKKTVLDESKTTPSQSSNRFESLPEGFLNGSTFQVVVSSLKTEMSTAEREATSVAKKKAFQMLQSHPKKTITPKGKEELKSISESGKITSKGEVSGKKYFVYQITRPGLKILVETKLP